MCLRKILEVLFYNVLRGFLGAFNTKSRYFPLIFFDIRMVYVSTGKGVVLFPKHVGVV